MLGGSDWVINTCNVKNVIQGWVVQKLVNAKPDNNNNNNNNSNTLCILIKMIFTAYCFVQFEIPQTQN